jgi:hypothetical protein
MTGAFGSPSPLVRRVAVAVGAAMLGVIVMGAACGEPLFKRVAKAMNGCLAVRDPVFKQGDGLAAIATPLPAAVDSIASETAYTYGLISYQQEGDAAQTQAELTCALELGAHYNHPDTEAWLAMYLKHPNAPVAALARRELNRLRRLNGQAPLPENSATTP